MSTTLGVTLADQGFKTDATIHANLGTPALVEHALKKGEGQLTKHGALLVDTGKFTGRSVKDKYIVRDATTEDTINWGTINQPMAVEHWANLKADFLTHLQGQGELYVADLFGGSQPEYRVNVRVITQMAWHNLFIRTLLVRPDASELPGFEPKWRDIVHYIVGITEEIWTDAAVDRIRERFGRDAVQKGLAFRASGVNTSSPYSAK